MTKRQIKGEDAPVDTTETTTPVESAGNGAFITETKAQPIMLRNVDTKDPDLMSLLQRSSDLK